MISEVREVKDEMQWEVRSERMKEGKMRMKWMKGSNISDQVGGGRAMSLKEVVSLDFSRILFSCLIWLFLHTVSSPFGYTTNTK